MGIVDSHVCEVIVEFTEQAKLILLLFSLKLYKSKRMLIITFSEVHATIGYGKHLKTFYLLRSSNLEIVLCLPSLRAVVCDNKRGHNGNEGKRLDAEDGELVAPADDGLQGEDVAHSQKQVAAQDVQGRGLQGGPQKGQVEPLEHC